MRRAYGALGAAVATIALPHVATAQTESRLSADVAGTAGYSNNPFSVADNNTGAAVVTLDIAPRYQLLTPRSTITISGDANFQRYLSRYGQNNSYSAALDYAGRPSERLSTHLRLDLSSAVLGAFNNYLPTASGGGLTGSGFTDTTTPGSAATGAIGGTAGAVTSTSPTTIGLPATTLVPFTDVGLFGLRNRRREARLGGDMQLTASQRDTLTASAYVELARYPGLEVSNYNAYGGTLGYSRTVSSSLNVGLRASIGQNDYRVSGANSRVVSLEATANARLNERWTASGSLGASFVNNAAVVSTTATSLSGSLSLCRNGPLTNLCLQATRQVVPTGFAGSQYVTSAGASWSRRLNERENLSLSANYSQVGGGNTRLLTGGLPLEDKYIQTVAGYDRRLGQRLRFVASATYRQLLDSNNINRPADFGGQIGLSYRFGDRR